MIDISIIFMIGLILWLPMLYAIFEAQILARVAYLVMSRISYEKYLIDRKADKLLRPFVFIAAAAGSCLFVIDLMVV